MIIGDEFSKKNQNVLKEVGRLSNGDTGYKIPVRDINENLGHGRTEIKNILEYLQYLGYIKTITIGGPLLYGHVTITRKGLNKYKEIRQE